MLQYDFTDTRLFDAPSRTMLPNDAEMFVITAALLLVHEAAYTELNDGELALSASNVEAVAQCIETRLPEFARDLQRLGTLRERLADFVGMHVAGSGPNENSPFQKPT